MASSRRPVSPGNLDLGDLHGTIQKIPFWPLHAEIILTKLTMRMMTLMSRILLGKMDFPYIEQKPSARGLSLQF